MSDKEEIRRTQKTGVCLFVLVASVILVVFFIARGRVESQLCFVVDILRARVPHKTPLPKFVDSHAETPFGIGTVCFDEIEQLVEWRIDETFQFAYGDSLIDARLHGPLNETTHVAPSVLAMGLHRNSKRQLSGSSVVSMRVLSDAIAFPATYYVAVYVQNTAGTAEIEAGRSPLFLSSK